MKKVSLAYWVKAQIHNLNDPETQAFLPAIETYVREGSHPEFIFDESPFALANALYLAWKKRTGVYDGMYPTPLDVAVHAARLLELDPGRTVLDPGCGFGNLTWAAQRCGYRAVGIELRTWPVTWARALGLDVRQGNFLECHVPDFDAVLCNPTFGRPFGPVDIGLSFMQRIAYIARPGTQVAAILPVDFMSKERPKAHVEMCRRYQVLDQEPLSADTFKPLASIRAMLYLLEVQ